PELLLDWREHFSQEQLREFVPSFVAEGDIDGRLVLLPIAKSSNALFINATIFDQFSRETGVKYEDLATWEGMFRAAKRYYQWSGGKPFFKYDDWILYGMLNTIALGGEFFTDGAINFRDEVFRSVWRKLAESAVSGGVCPIPGYATTAMMTGETLCGVESTASILYFEDTVTFPDNTTIPLRLTILPPPYFQDGKRLTLQRGTGLGVMKSTKEKERAAVIFAEWLTEVDNNMRFSGESGYLPVKEAAYKDYLKQSKVQGRADTYGRLHKTIQKIHAEYEFYTPPFFENYGEMEKKFSDAHIDIFREYRGKIIDRANPEALYESMFEKLEAAME
ncbi:extracellular solute-binding protein, partial [Desulfovibrio sp. OttesenSCG-928-F20]|nr:extracellular solute-binding protein [Desulfovibrio sp. OttesenSCG-928-F20]